MSDSPELRIAMLGMVPGNGHPWSWSAIVNGYEREPMQACPYPVIPEYLGRRPAGSVGIPGARVTHIWTDDPDDAPRVAAAARIPHVAARPEDVIGEVDAVIIATDDGNDHAARARPFAEAGLPVFIDKPLAINLPDLRQMVSWKREGRRLLSTSGMRYAPEMDALADAREELGELRWITSFTCKSWERYGIHALEAVWPLLGPGFVGVRTAARPGSDVVHLVHGGGAQVTVAAVEDAAGSFGAVHVYGTKGHRALALQDTYTAFRRQLAAFIEYARTGTAPFAFEETVELMLILIAGVRSREQDGAQVLLADLYDELAGAAPPPAHIPRPDAGFRKTRNS